MRNPNSSMGFQGGIRVSHIRVKHFQSLLWLACALTGVSDTAAASYQSNRELAADLKALASEHAKVVRVSSLVKSRAEHDVWLVRVGVGEKVDERPALLVLAGIEGNDLIGTASVVAWGKSLATRYLSDEKVRQLLDTRTIYILPRVNADAADSFFAKPRVERAISTLPVDDDHDGFLDEDGPEDLNNDGLITWIRVEDAEGEYIPDPVDSRLLLKADRAKGEVGRRRYLPEGRDNDGDEAWNEDPVGGVNFNRNFSYNFKFFAPNSGVHQISETETRALADFVVAHPNIAMVFTFGAVDNLTQPPKAETAGANRRPQTDLQPDDLPFYRELGKAWRDALGLKKELPPAAEAGTFSDWMYFHRGRLSLAARPWSPALQVELGKGKKSEEEKKEPKDEKKEEKKDEKKPDSRNEEERAFLKWLDENAKEAFVAWTKIDHPDFPGKTVEVGGYAPFAKTNPPERLIEDLARKHGEFLTTLVGKFPEVRVRNTKVKDLGNRVFEVVAQIENVGYLPTSLRQGDATREVHPTRVEIDVDEKAVLSGSKRVMLGTIEGSGGMREARWIIHAGGKNRLRLTATSMLGGAVESDIELK